MSLAHDIACYAVNAERERRLASLVVTVDGIGYDGDPKTRAILGELLTATTNGVPVPWPMPWRCADNVTRTMSLAKAVEVSAAILVAAQAVYAYSWALKDTIIPALTDAEVHALDVAADTYWSAP